MVMINMRGLIILTLSLRPVQGSIMRDQSSAYHIRVERGAVETSEHGNAALPVQSKAHLRNPVTVRSTQRQQANYSSTAQCKSMRGQWRSLRDQPLERERERERA